MVERLTDQIANRDADAVEAIAQAEQRIEDLKRENAQLREERVSKSYPGRGGPSPRAGRVHPIWTRVHEGRAGPHQSERSERAWTMAVRVALAGAAAGRLDGLTVHRSPCR